MNVLNAHVNAPFSSFQTSILPIFRSSGNTPFVNFRLKLAKPAWAGRFQPVKSTMDSQGRLLLAVQQAKPNPDRRQVSEQPTSACVSIATAPRALVLEFGTK
jgi:hypothetical protein